MKYADSEICSSCREPLEGATVACARCDFELTSPAAAQLWRTLTEADYWLAKASHSPLEKPVQPAVPVANYDSAAGYGPAYPASNRQPQFNSYSKPPRKPIDTGAVLLVLGALFLMVAGTIASALFLGFFALPLMTVVAAGIGIMTDGKKLKASTETMIAITAAMAGLSGGLFMWESDRGLFVWSLLMFGASLTFIYLTQGKLDYATPKILMALSLIPLYISAQAIVNDLSGYTYSWDGVLPALMLAGFAAVGLLLDIKYYKQFSLFMVTIFSSTAILASLGEFVSFSQFSELYGQGHAYPLIVMTLALAASIYAMADNRYRQIVLALTYLLGLTVVALTLGSFGQDRLGLIAIMAIALVGLGLKERTWFNDTILATSLAPILLGILVYAAMLVEQLENASAMLAIRYRDWNETFWAPEWSVWFSLALMALAAAALIILSKNERFPLVKAYERWLLPPWAGLALVTSVLYLYPNNFTLSASLIVAGVFAAIATRTLLAGGAFIALAPWLLLNYSGTDTIMWFAASIALLALAFKLKDMEEVTWLAVAFGSFYAIAGLTTLGIYYDWTAEVHTLVLALAVASGTLAGAYLAILKPKLQYSEAAGLLFPTLAILTFAVGDTDAAWVSLLALIMGSACVGSSFIHNNVYYRSIGAGLIGLAWCARLVASDITVPEAYTVPFAIILLVAGGYKMMKLEHASSWQYVAPGIALALLPSVPWILADPVSLRALLAAFAATIILFVGIRENWQAAVVLSSLFLAAGVLLELGPYMLMLSRWLLIGGFGIIFVALGVTFEQRIKEGKALAAYLGNMR